MRNTLFILLLFVGGMVNAQSAPTFSNYSVGNSGCTISLPAIPGDVTLEYSPDSAKVWTIEALDSSMNAYYHFGAIVVKLNGGNADEEILKAYLDYLKGAFSIESSDGYVSGYTLPSNEDATGIKDNWIDKDGDKWKVMGWQKGDGYMIVQFEYGPATYPNSDVMNTFLHGVRFPGD